MNKAHLQNECKIEEIPRTSQSLHLGNASKLRVEGTQNFLEVAGEKVRVFCRYLADFYHSKSVLKLRKHVF